MRQYAAESIILLAFILVPSLAQVGAQATLPMPSTGNPDLQILLDAARSVPAEFNADILLTAIEAGLVQDDKAKQTLLREAFDLAGSAQERVALRRATGGGIFATSLNDVSRRGLDQISLRSRAVQALLAFDAEGARMQFAQIALPLEKALSCEERLIPDLSLYYATMSRVLSTMQGSAERELLLSAHVASIATPSQIEPFANLLLSSNIGPEALSSLVYAFAGRLPDLRQDRREFTSLFARTITSLARLAKASPPPSRDFLVSQARTWVLKSIHHGMCEQRATLVLDEPGSESRSRVEPPKPEERFNVELAVLSQANPAPRIEEQHILSRDMHPGPEVERSSEEYLAANRVRILLGNETPENKRLPRWQEEMDRLISTIQQWTNSSPDVQDLNRFYLEKAQTLRSLLTIHESMIDVKGMSQAEYFEAVRSSKPANIRGRDRILVELAQFLDSRAATTVYTRRRLVWFAPVGLMLGSFAGSSDLDTVFAASRHPVLSLYGRLSALVTASKR